MTGAFLDTTVVVALAEGATPNQRQTAASLKRYQPIEAPYYALREILAGYVRYLCDVHNTILAAENPGEAGLALLKRSPLQGRSREAKQKILFEHLNRAYRSDASAMDHKRELLLDLQLRASSTWVRARRLKGVAIVQQLACFNSGDLTTNVSGELRGPNDSFNCIQTERCAAAAYVHDDQIGMKALIDKLRPARDAVQKRESTSRRKALKELLKVGPQAFNKSMCRSLGDAYFALKCPRGFQLLTTNLSDFEPMCEALGKNALKP